MLKIVHILMLHQLLVSPPVTSISSSMHYFTSTAHISQLLNSKLRLADALLGFADNETLRLDRLREFARGLQRETPGGEAAAEGAEHPVAAFLTIRRMGRDWRRLLGSCGDAPDAVLRSAGLELPTEDEFDGAADALVRLQDVYDISAESMVRGQLTVGSRGLRQPSAADGSGSGRLLLSAEDCLHLARRAFNRSLDLVGMDWIRLLVGSDTFPTVESAQRLVAVLDILQEKFQQKASQKDPELGQLLEDIWSNTKGNIAEFAKIANFHLPRVQGKQSDLLNYRKLCKDGSFTRNGTAAQQHVCRYAVPHHFYTLAPVKEELLNADPRVVFLYDVLTDRESDRLMEVADPKLRRAMVIDHGFTDSRISKSAFLGYDFDWSVKQVNRKLGHITGLNETDSDSLQVGNYGIGGHFNPHIDSFGGGVSHGNNRVATVLLYLNNVAQGGGTVFPRLGLRVLPVKNGALFWYNMRRNSSDIYDTTHAACPVLEGSKWVANKWIYYLGQMYRRPCSLSQSE